MNTIDWKAIPTELKEAGFTVSYCKILSSPGNPLWRATAQRDGKVLNTLECDLKTALVELEKQTQEPTHDWRAVGEVG